MKAKIGTYCTVSAVVTRADGTVEDLGVICQGKGQIIKPDKLTFIQKIRRIFTNG